MPSSKWKLYGAITLIISLVALFWFYKIRSTDSSNRILQQAIDSLCNLIPKDTLPEEFNRHRSEALRLSTEMNDSVRIAKTINATGLHFYNKPQFDSALHYFTMAQAIAVRKNADALAVNAGLRRADAFFMAGKTAEAEQTYRAEFRKCVARNDSVNAYTAAEQLGIYFLTMEQYDRGEAIFDSGFVYVRTDTAFYAMSSYYSHKGIFARQRSDNIGSVKYYQQAIEALRKSEKLAPFLAATQLNMGISFKDMGMYEIAIQNLLPATAYFETHDKPSEQASGYNTLGNTYAELKQYSQALKYHRKSLQLRKKIDNLGGQAGSLNNIGQTYIYLQQYDSAWYYLQKSLELKTRIKSSNRSSTLNLLGEVYIARAQPDSARLYFMESVYAQPENKEKKEQATSLNNLGRLATAEGRYDDATQLLDEARLICHSMAAKKVLLRNYELTTANYRAAGRLQDALRFTDSLIQLKDTLLTKEIDRSIAEMEVKYETEKSARKLAQMNELNKEEQARGKQQRITIYAMGASIALLMLIIGFAVFAYRSKKKSLRQSEEIIHQKQLVIEHKQHMLGELHHRIKNNLQVLATLLSLQQKRLPDAASREALKAVENRLDAMLLVHTGLYGKSASGSIHIREYLQKLNNNLVASFGFAPGTIRITLLIEDLRLDADTALNIGFVANEIICNSLKHAFAGINEPELHIRAWKDNDHYRFIFGDNGTGISDDYNEMREDAFGLRLIRMLVQQMNGTISLQPGETGTQYEVTIPISNIQA